MLPAASSSARSSPHRRAHRSSKGSEVKGFKIDSLSAVTQVVNSWYREERSFKSNPILKVAPETDAANRASIRQRAQKNCWAIRSCLHGPLESRLSLEHHCNISISRPP